jgi:hypothetical protein
MGLINNNLTTFLYQVQLNMSWGRLLKVVDMILIAKR